MRSMFSIGQALNHFDRAHPFSECLLCKKSILVLYSRRGWVDHNPTDMYFPLLSNNASIYSKVCGNHFLSLKGIAYHCVNSLYQVSCRWVLIEHLCARMHALGVRKISRRPLNLSVSVESEFCSPEYIRVVFSMASPFSIRFKGC